MVQSVCTHITDTTVTGLQDYSTTENSNDNSGNITDDCDTEIESEEQVTNNTNNREKINHKA